MVPLSSIINAIHAAITLAFSINYAYLKVIKTCKG